MTNEELVEYYRAGARKVEDILLRVSPRERESVDRLMQAWRYLIKQQALYRKCVEFNRVARASEKARAATA